jgi:hypothetical protein
VSSKHYVSPGFNEVAEIEKFLLGHSSNEVIEKLVVSDVEPFQHERALRLFHWSFTSISSYVLKTWWLDTGALLP